MNRILRYLASLAEDANLALQASDSWALQPQPAPALGLDHPTYLRRRIIIDGLPGSLPRVPAQPAYRPGCHVSR